MSVRTLVHLLVLLLLAVAFWCAGCGPSAPPASAPEGAAPTASPGAGAAAPESGTGAEGTPAPAADATDQGAAAPPAAADPLRAPLAAPPENLPPPVALTDSDWPQFRGLDRTGTSRERNLLRAWPEGGPVQLWETTVGEGYSAPSVVGGRVYLNDYDEANNQWLVRCLDLETGEQLWKYAVDKRVRPNHAITRTAPASDGAYVFAIDPKCELHCLDARDGRPLWRLPIPEAYGSQIPAWYNGQCPLVTDKAVVIATGGRALMTALDKPTGQTLWETPNPDQMPLSHSSVMPVTIDGVDQYVYMSMTGVVGADASDGSLLWTFPWKFNIAVPTSVASIGDGRLFITSCYQAPTGICQVTRRDGQWSAEQLVRLPPSGWNSEVHTPILYEGRLYGVGKKRRGLWTCLDLEGKELWENEPRTATFDLGGYLLADGMFYVLEGKTGILRLLDATAEEYAELASAQVLRGPEVWAPPVLSRGKLLVRDLHRLVCLQVGAGEGVAVATAGEGGP